MDLENKKLIKNIEIKLGGCIGNIIHWNNKYIIFIDEKDDVLKIVDLTINKIIFVIKPIDTFRYFKKLNHPIYGESLLSSGENISLWTI